MGASANTSDSNITGLAIAEEVLGTPGTLPGTPDWYAIEPNSYSDFGTQLSTTERSTINSSRQKRKPITTGVDSKGGFTIDFTTKVLYKVMQGFMFADWREKRVQASTAVSGTQYTVAANGTDFAVNSLAYAEGFGLGANNGLKLVTASTATTISVTGLSAEASPPAGAQLTRVGYQGASGDIVLTVVSGLANLTSTTLDFTTLGLIPGEWIYVGGDSAGVRFATAGCNGLYRIKSIFAHQIIFDRCPLTPTADAGAGKTIQLFFGHVLKNEASSALQKFRTYTLERTYNATNVEYVEGAGANQIKLGMKTKDRVTAELSFVGMKGETATAQKAGNRWAIPTEEAVFNTATSFSRLQVYNDTGSAALATFVTDMNLTISNGITPAEAISSSLGAVDLTAGDFSVSGDLEAYFSTIAAVTAVQTNPDCSVTIGMVENATTATVGAQAQGWLFDLPLLSMSDGKLKVEKDKPVKLPLKFGAAGHTTLNHTLLVQRFAYLPQLAL